MVDRVDISVVIVSWNVRDALRQCLASVFQERGLTYEVFVVDNASADGSAAMVRQEFPQAQLLANTRNIGFAQANNQALTHATGRAVLLLNPDTLLHEGTLASIVAYFDAHADVGILGGKIFHGDGSLQRSVLRFPTFASQALVLLKVQAFSLAPKPLRDYYALDFDYTREADVDQVMGSFFAIRRAALDGIGNLDGGFFLWFEEVDYCKRAKAAGWNVRYTPAVSVTHIGGKSFGQLLSLEQQIIFNRSMLRYFHKHHGMLAYAAIFLLSFPSYLLAVGENLVRRWYVPKSVR